MYVNSPGAESGSYSLTFLGKKVGRHRSVAPAGKQFAWETTVRSACPEDRVVSSRVAKVPVAAQELEELPGSVPELQDERPCPIIHNTQLDQYEKTTAGVSGKKVTATRPHSYTRNQRGERVGWVLHDTENDEIVKRGQFVEYFR